MEAPQLSAEQPALGLAAGTGGELVAAVPPGGPEHEGDLGRHVEPVLGGASVQAVLDLAGVAQGDADAPEVAEAVADAVADNAGFRRRRRR